MWSTRSSGRRQRCARTAFRRRWRSVWPSACSSLLLLVVAACGGSEEAAPPQPQRLPHTVAEPLAARSERVAAALRAGDACTADREADELRAAATAAVDAGRVPPRYQRELLANANELAERVSCPPPAVPPQEPQPEEEEGDDGEQGKGKGKRDDEDKPGRGAGKGEEDDGESAVVEDDTPPSHESEEPENPSGVTVTVPPPVTVPSVP